MKAAIERAVDWDVDARFEGVAPFVDCLTETLTPKTLDAVEPVLPTVDADDTQGSRAGPLAFIRGHRAAVTVGAMLVAGLAAIVILKPGATDTPLPPTAPAVTSGDAAADRRDSAPVLSADSAAGQDVQARPGQWPIAMVRIEAGTFLMGSPKTEKGRNDDEAQHRVTIARAFSIGRTEVTQGQYQRVMRKNPSNHKRCGPTCPVEKVSWLDAVRFCNALSRQSKLPVCYAIGKRDTVSWRTLARCTGYRLPTEAEWEYAARAGTTHRYAGTSSSNEVCAFGNVADETAKEKHSDWTTFSCDDGRADTAPVATFKPNAVGLYDMTGNVWEWAWDWYAKNPRGGADPHGPSSGHNRVYRGGGFISWPADARVANRCRYAPSYRSRYLGFRVARSLP